MPNIPGHGSAFLARKVGAGGLFQKNILRSCYWRVSGLRLTIINDYIDNIQGGESSIIDNIQGGELADDPFVEPPGWSWCVRGKFKQKRNWGKTTSWQAATSSRVWSCQVFIFKGFHTLFKFDGNIFCIWHILLIWWKDYPGSFVFDTFFSL